MTPYKMQYLVCLGTGILVGKFFHQKSPKIGSNLRKFEKNWVILIKI